MANRPVPERVPPCGCAAPGTSDPGTCYCGVDNLLRIIRRRYSLAVMNAIHNRRDARYHEIEVALPGVSTSTLAETLRALTAAQLVNRRERVDNPSHVTYELTASGTKLLSKLRRLLGDVQP